MGEHQCPERHLEGDYCGGGVDPAEQATQMRTHPGSYDPSQENSIHLIVRVREPITSRA